MKTSTLSKTRQGQKTPCDSALPFLSYTKEKISRANGFWQILPVFYAKTVLFAAERRGRTVSSPEVGGGGDPHQNSTRYKMRASARSPELPFVKNTMSKVFTKFITPTVGGITGCADVSVKTESLPPYLKTEAGTDLTEVVTGLSEVVTDLWFFVWGRYRPH